MYNDVCQPMVIGASSTPTGIPNLRYNEKRNFIQCKQFKCDTAQLWSSLMVLQLL